MMDPKRWHEGRRGARGIVRCLSLRIQWLEGPIRLFLCPRNWAFLSKKKFAYQEKVAIIQSAGLGKSFSLLMIGVSHNAPNFN
jgi:hypothetical protein